MNKSNALKPEAAADLMSLAPIYETLNGPMSECREKMAKAVEEWQQEVVRFMKERADRNHRAAQSAAKCKTVPDFLSLQQEWTRDVATDYLEEAHKLQKLTSQMIEASLMPVNAWMNSIQDKTK